MITGDELEARLKDDGNMLNGGYFDYWDFFHEARPGDKVDVLGLGEVEVLESVTYRDGDYQGNDSYENYIVVKVGDQIFRKTGYYNSWDGGAWDGAWHEVKKVEKTISVWEKA